MEPSYANLFVGYLENKYTCNYHGPKIDLYKRHIDDCGGSTSSSRAELNRDLLPQSICSPDSKREVFEISLAFLDNNNKLSINTTVSLKKQQQILITTFVLSSTTRKNAIILSVS